MHAHSVALHFMHYNFVKIHSSLRTTPAQAADVTDRLWEISDLVALLGAREVKLDHYPSLALKSRPSTHLLSKSKTSSQGFALNLIHHSRQPGFQNVRGSIT